MVNKRAESVVKVYSEDMEWIRDEQRRLQKTLKQKVPQPEIIAALIRQKTGRLERTVERRPARDQKWHDMLDIVLRSAERIGIELNLTWAVRSLNRTPKSEKEIDEQVREKLA